MCMWRKLTWTLTSPPPQPSDVTWDVHVLNEICVFSKTAKTLARFSPRWHKTSYCNYNWKGKLQIARGRCGRHNLLYFCMRFQYVSMQVVLQYFEPVLDLQSSNVLSEDPWPLVIWRSSAVGAPKWTVPLHCARSKDVKSAAWLKINFKAKIACSLVASDICGAINVLGTGIQQ